MSKNPVVNALAAAAYIGAIVLFIGFIAEPNEPDTLFAPLAMISLFTLSAGVMGYLFLYQPALLILDGKKEEGGAFFLKTLGTFGAIVAVFLVLLVLLG